MRDAPGETRRTRLLAPSLEYFRVIAELGSFTAAARALHVSQPSLSVAVRKLEEELGAKLFARGARGVEPTPSGLALLERTRQAARELGAAEDEIRSLRDEPRGRYVLGCHESLGAYALPGFLGNFFETYPEIEVSLWNGNSRDVEAAIIDRRIDLGLVVNPSSHPDTVVHHLFDDNVGLVVASSRVGRSRTQTARKLFAELPLIHVSVLRQTQDIVAQLARAGLAPKRTIDCSGMELVKSLVLDGVGVGILPLRVATHGVPSRAFTLFGDEFPRFSDRICLVRRFDMPQAVASRVLLGALRDHAKRMPSVEALGKTRLGTVR